MTFYNWPFVCMKFNGCMTGLKKYVNVVCLTVEVVEKDHLVVCITLLSLQGVCRWFRYTDLPACLS